MVLEHRGDLRTGRIGDLNARVSGYERLNIVDQFVDKVQDLEVGEMEILVRVVGSLRVFDIER